MDQPYYRFLRGYTLDPGFSTQLDTESINVTTYRINWEELDPGPVGEYLEIIDHDPENSCFYKPIDLNHKFISSQQGLTPSEGNPLFHQQLVYLIGMKTIEHFERSLGRQLIWKHRELPVTDKGPDNETPEKKFMSMAKHFRKEEVRRLRIYPHAKETANAFYDPRKQALLFGYFQATNSSNGNNLPGGFVFTCLSPDIIAHEMTHAILDSIHGFFLENTNKDVAAFHEGFSDIISLLQRFTIRELIEHQFTITRGSLDKFNVLGELAVQFGEALGHRRGALRSAIGKMQDGEWSRQKPSREDYHSWTEPHKGGSVLVSTIFDAYIKLYNYRTQDLLRIATGGTGVLPQGFVNVDLIKRLSNEAAEIAEHLLHICIRALDYCPPVDITFGDYFRGLITADIEASPSDDKGYRVALIEAFRARGIFPKDVNTLSDEALRWTKDELDTAENAIEQRVLSVILEVLKPHVNELFLIRTRSMFYLQSRVLQDKLERYLQDEVQHDLKKRDIDLAHWRKLLVRLGLSADPFRLEFDGKHYDFEPPPIKVHVFKPTSRQGKNGLPEKQLIVTFTQTVNKQDGNFMIQFRGGCTLIVLIDQSLSAEYIIVKKITSKGRFKDQLEFQTGINSSQTNSMDSVYQDQDANTFNSLDFEKLHLSHPE